ncbi:transmembrane protein 163 isoform X2 [Taeniopygia guttata]|uniref:transmembrane protein 163 isoform X2 n=1 Tax=Taeniopygia guttata TaxID=59729 RepID=UPI0011AF6678|nr:transmembrane protein 163 isoform X2 [Taeniopygia guttata]XP_039926092.1 transmembrane protein 163 isoform X2 [Hirundo rustica]
MEPSAAPLDTTPNPAIVQPPGANPPGAPREQQQEQLRIGESGQFSEGLEDRAVSVMRYSASSFGFAFDATLDVLSSAIVLWRYSNAAAVHSAHREYMACVILGVIFLLSSICIVIKAIHDLAKRVLPEVDDFLYSVSVLSGILCTVLAVIKFMLGKVLTSRALITDGFNSLVGGIMGFSILLSAEVFKHNSSVWYLDGSIGVLIGLTISAYGIKLLIDMVPRVRQTRHYEMFE